MAPMLTSSSTAVHHGRNPHGNLGPTACGAEAFERRRTGGDTPARRTAGVSGAISFECTRCGTGGTDHVLNRPFPRA